MSILNKDFGSSNPYHDPEEVGLKIIASIEWSHRAYSFNITCVWIEDETQDIYMATSSGCSCPRPFEEFHSLADLIRVENASQIDELIKSRTTRDTYDTDEGANPDEVRVFRDLAVRSIDK